MDSEAIYSPGLCVCSRFVWLSVSGAHRFGPLSLFCPQFAARLRCLPSLIHLINKHTSPVTSLLYLASPQFPQSVSVVLLCVLAIRAGGPDEGGKEVKEEEAHVSCLCKSECHSGKQRECLVITAWRRTDRLDPRSDTRLSQDLMAFVFSQEEDKGREKKPKKRQLLNVNACVNKAVFGRAIRTQHFAIYSTYFTSCIKCSICPKSFVGKTCSVI